MYSSTSLFCSVLSLSLYSFTIMEFCFFFLFSADEEDKKLIRIVLTKSNRDAGNCWPSLLEGEYSADPWVQDEMQKKLTLERFQRENPGFDFSRAEISGNYSKGGPDFSNLQK
ncbi:hypothetical protein GDO78_006270 [Eleutherodactylus coqui]|uniref:NudC domain-containing protein 2 n=1 Tax=Eleutherodactylus coqui TaxID=57060 RepID=A0A8J6KEE3_ELECQ|nr:hypothetical protein GDO78_006270 [Eleutherodactylus coqui]